MNKQKIGVFLVVVALIGSAASIISVLKARQKQGRPGLKLVEKPTFDSRGEVVCPISVGLPETILGYVSTNMPVEDVELGYLPKDTTYGRRTYFQTDSEKEL